MEDDLKIRPADGRDLHGLAALRCEFLRKGYRGILPDESLSNATPARYEPLLAEWLASPEWMVDAMEMGGVLCGYAAAHAAPDGGTGWIEEIRTVEPSTAEQAQRLIGHAVDRLRASGCTAVETWLMRDSFRMRLLFEACGFRHDGQEHRRSTADGTAYEMRHYLLRL